MSVKKVVIKRENKLSDLGDQGHGVPLPQLVVLQAVGAHCRLPAEVDEEDRRPEHLQVATAAALATSRPLPLAVEESSQGVDRQGIPAYIRRPHQEPQVAQLRRPAHRIGEVEAHVDEEAAEHQNSHLPLLPPMHSMGETHAWLACPR